MGFPYFVWNGHAAYEFGVIVSEYPPIMRPKERVTTKTVPGKGGHLTFLETVAVPVYESYLRVVHCYIRPGASIQAIEQWLTGSGIVIFGNEPDRYYNARIINNFDFNKIVRGKQYYEFDVPFYCQPYKGLVPIEENIVINTTGATIQNPGNVPALPKVTLFGAGEITFTLGGGMVQLTNIIDGIVMDWENQECTSLDGGFLLNNRVSGTQYIPIGTSVVSWTGNVIQAVIQPNWRWI